MTLVKAIFLRRLKVDLRYPVQLIFKIIFPPLMTLIPLFLAFSIGGGLESVGTIFAKYTGSREFIFL